MAPPAAPYSSSGSLDDFLDPLRIDLDRCHHLSRLFLANFAHLAAESRDQFLPTPISESILRPVADHGQGRHLAIDIGGTNLRVGFVQLVAKPDVNGFASNGRIQRHLEKSWPISDQLKSDNADSLFRWIGKCIAEVVDEGCRAFQISRDAPLPLGVTFSFPTEQRSLSEATITSMGKGFALPPDVELGARLQQGYDKMRAATHLPPIRVVAIANDSVATLVSFIFNYDGTAHRRAAMGLILGTGSNATVPLRSNHLHPSKRPQKVSVLPGEAVDDVKIAVNTEWSIRGTEPPMRQLGFITPWDDQLSAKNETPGFQPLEYMTAGRYLGELGRIMLLSYMTETLGLPSKVLPPALLEAHSLTTTFLSHFKPLGPTSALVSKLRTTFPERQQETGFAWTEHLAEALYRIAKAIELRAAGITAAGILALLTLAEELPAEGASAEPSAGEFGVGYTGGCIVPFQDYLADCQSLVDGLVVKRYGRESRVRVALSPCHDGGITGAGILVAAALSSQEAGGASGV
ncbi:hexokinase domain-containing protein [Hirsutella rhossiliensis]|uniref:Phosphotransferase n=1 Tax=Hirsutella rhossiliensis TaxID=111463 RepID=A0A9P8N2F3_9HYPO|nr:hexokinase domain-containing protein [Hirsutella rhossiliensis]KAH0965619.1 hexokinase domain-containing protein [Hirsutella rhossiliensis]